MSGSKNVRKGYPLALKLVYLAGGFHDIKRAVKVVSVQHYAILYLEVDHEEADS